MLPTKVLAAAGSGTVVAGLLIAVLATPARDAFEDLGSSTAVHGLALRP